MLSRLFPVFLVSIVLVNAQVSINVSTETYFTDLEENSFCFHYTRINGGDLFRLPKKVCGSDETPLTAEKFNFPNNCASNEDFETFANADFKQRVAASSKTG
ncbi:unnamed protein product [Caenorhabditis auriculariae]|uniref:Uncharacterized protein n=1 Tax=Caenorhabditis auriculariae TaxID=2777116 RepID=A0A8S1HVU4_9PELO|nr:unnamed protein product [Caenorhabditis auriculariae]